MTMWLRIFKHLLPRGKAWRLTVDRTLRKFFAGLSGVGADAKTAIDAKYDDISPQKTTQLAAWEDQFALPASSLTDQERRDRLDAAWKALGAQDPRYIQTTLRDAGFDVYVHEWWQPIGGRPAGGSINGDVTPVARDPFQYLNDGSVGAPWVTVDGRAEAMDGGAEAMDGSTSAPIGYPLVNKITVASNNAVSDGGPAMQDGGLAASDGAIYTTYADKQYTMPAGAGTYPYYMYIGAQIFPQQASVPAARRHEFEALCLKICPTELWLGILVTYN